MKENVKIFATPEAHELLLKPDGGLEIQDAVQDAIELATGASNPTVDHFIADSPLSIAALWAEDPNESSYVLIYKHDGFPHYYGLDKNYFLEQIARSTPISLS